MGGLRPRAAVDLRHELPRLQSSSAAKLGFSLMGGALAGFLFCAEVSLFVEPLIWCIGCSAGVDDGEILRLSLMATPRALFYSVGAGLLGGLVWFVLPGRIVLGRAAFGVSMAACVVGRALFPVGRFRPCHGDSRSASGFDRCPPHPGTGRGGPTSSGACCCGGWRRATSAD